MIKIKKESLNCSTNDKLLGASYDSRLQNAFKNFILDAPCATVINGLTCSGEISNNLIEDYFLGP